MDAGDGVSHLVEHFQCNGNTLRTGKLRTSLLSFPHPLYDGVRHHDARHLIGQELGIAQREDGPESGDDGNLPLLRPLQEARERQHDDIDIDRVVWDPEYREEVRELLRRGD